MFDGDNLSLAPLFAAAVAEMEEEELHEVHVRPLIDQQLRAANSGDRDTDLQSLLLGVFRLMENDGDTSAEEGGRVRSVVGVS